MKTSKNILDILHAVGHVLQMTLELHTSFCFVIESDEMKNVIKAGQNSGKVSFHFIVYTIARHAGNEKGE